MIIHVKPSPLMNPLETRISYEEWLSLSGIAWEAGNYEAYLFCMESITRPEPDNSVNYYLTTVNPN